MSSSRHITIIGAGLAGCEASWQLAQAGFLVTLIEQKPHKRTPAQNSDHMAELVCSNSLRSKNSNNAVGLLKDEMSALGSLVIRLACENRVPAGDALAVDREAFAAAIEQAIRQHPNIKLVSRCVEALPDAHDGECIIATGPLTDEALALDIVRATGEGQLAFYDAIAPIVAGDSIDRSFAFPASRWDKGEPEDYLNCPLNQEEYTRLISFLRTAECYPAKDFETPKFFQGCLPIEVMAGYGEDTLRFGPLKPAGLTDPRTGRWPHAVVQLRAEDVGRQAYNLVGMQTKLKQPQQRLLLQLIPGLQNAQILRFGAMHRNTFINSPDLLDQRLRLKAQPHIRFAGQITGVEGYVESAACGLLVALLRRLEELGVQHGGPPDDTALGVLWAHILGSHRLPGRAHEPQNINWGMWPSHEIVTGSKKKIPKPERQRLRLERAKKALVQWATQIGFSLGPSIAERLAAQVELSLASKDAVINDAQREQQRQAL